MTVLVVALIAAGGLLVATWAALQGRSSRTTAVFYLGLIVGLWAAIGLLVLGAFALYDFTT